MIKIGMQIHITEKCLYHCKHCYVEDKQVDMEDNVVYAIGDQINRLKQSGFSIQNIALTGGDPLCHPKWEKFVSFFKGRGLCVSLMGTPKTLNVDTVQTIKRLGVDQFQVSLDGLAQNHNYIRGKNSFQETIEALFLLSEHNIVPRVMYTINNKNNDDLFPLIEYLDKLEIPIVFSFAFCASLGQAKHSKEIASDNISIKRIISSYYEKEKEFIEKRSKVILGEKSHLLSAHKYSANDILKHAEKNWSIIGGCSAGWRSLCIVPNGDIYPCRRLPIKLGNVMEDEIDSVFLNHVIMKRLRDAHAFGLCSSCEKYKYCRGCPAIEYANRGEFSPSKCDFYLSSGNGKRLEEQYNDERQKIEKTYRNAQWDIDGFISNKDFLVSYHLLCRVEEIDSFIKDPLKWAEEKALILSADEMEFLLCSFYH